MRVIEEGNTLIAQEAAQVDVCPGCRNAISRQIAFAARSAGTFARKTTAGFIVRSAAPRNRRGFRRRRSSLGAYQAKGRGFLSVKPRHDFP